MREIIFANVGVVIQFERRIEADLSLHPDSEIGAVASNARPGRRKRTAACRETSGYDLRVVGKFMKPQSAAFDHGVVGDRYKAFEAQSGHERVVVLASEEQGMSSTGEISGRCEQGAAELQSGARFHFVAG